LKLFDKTRQSHRQSAERDESFVRDWCNSVPSSLFPLQRGAILINYCVKSM